MTKMKKDNKNRNLRTGESQMKDGRYRFRFTDQYGKQRTVYSWRLVSSDRMPPGKQDDICLREKERQIMRDMEDCIRVDKARMTLNELMQTYFELKTNLAVTTKNNYVHIWEKNIKNSELGNMKVNKICKSDILKFYAYLYSEKRFSIGTLQLYQNLLYPCFQVAVEDNIIRFNPCTGCMKDYVRGSMGSSKKALTVQEQKNLLDFIKNDSTYYPMYGLVACLLGTGLRIGEANGLTWNDIDFEKKCITIDHQIIYKNSTDKYKTHQTINAFFSAKPKHDSGRIIPMSEELEHVLKHHRAETYFVSKSSGYEVDGYNEFVFITEEGRLKTPGSIRRSINGMVSAYNKLEKHRAYDEKREPEYLPNISPHVLRHTFCTRMAENGMDVKVLQEIMGHKNISVTMQVYNHSSLERAQKEMSKIDAVINL